MGQPDIVLIMTDQQRHDQVGYVDPRFETPHLDALAASGVTFPMGTSAETTCAPARATLLTGMLAHRLPSEPSGHKLGLAQGYWTVAHALRAAGYQTALVGKMHLNPVHAAHGFDQMRMCEQLFPFAGYYDNETDEYRESLPLDAIEINDGTRSQPTGVFQGQDRCHPISWVRDQALDVLRSRRTDRPMFLIVSFLHPHAPVVPANPWASRFDSDREEIEDESFDHNVDVPESFFMGKPGVPVNCRKASGVRPERRRRHLALFRGLIAQLDDSIGSVLAQLDLAETLVAFTSDHGDYAGRRGLLDKVPWIPFDDLLRVPLVLAGPGVRGGHGSDALVQTADLVPTFLDSAGVEPPSAASAAVSVFAGESLMNLCGGDRGAEVDRARRDQFSATRLGFPAVRRGDLKLIRCRWSTDELLFDLAGDPREKVNLRSDPAYRAEGDDLSRCLIAELAREIPDLGIW